MTQETVFVPLRQLRLSPKNVRTTPTQDIAPLAQSLLAQGVLQNLIVVKKGKALYEVVAGGRRLSALQQLLKGRKVGADYRVPCITVEDSEASAASLTENTMREAMHPADEFEAFKRLADEGRNAEDIGALYHVTPAVVERRLKLANVAPSLIERFRHDEMGLETLMAFALSDDHAEQERVWSELRSFDRTPTGVRAALTKDEVPASDRLAKFVTLKAYQKAGGAVRRDLFDDENSGYLTDRALLERLASEKLARRAERAQAEEGATWSEVRLRFDHSERSQFSQVPLTRGKPSVAQAKRLAAIEAELAQLQEKEDPEEADDERQSVLEDQLAEIEQALERPNPEFAKLAGVVVTVDWQGKAEVHRGLVRAADAKTLKWTLREGTAEVGEEQGPQETQYSAALTQNLTGHFTAALQARIADSPSVALRLVTAALAGSIFTPMANDHCLAKINTRAAAISDSVPDVQSTRAGQELQAREAKWSDRVEKAEAVLPWLLLLSDAEVLDLLAYCVAVSVDAISPRKAVAGGSELAAAVGLDMRDYWKATAGGFLARVPKAAIIEAVREVKPDAAPVELETAKKEEVVRTAESILQEARWLPALLRGNPSA